MMAVSLLPGIHKATVTSHDVYFYPSTTSVRINEFLNSSMSTCTMRTVMNSPYKNTKTIHLRFETFGSVYVLEERRFAKQTCKQKEMKKSANYSS